MSFGKYHQVIYKVKDVVNVIENHIILNHLLNVLYLNIGTKYDYSKVEYIDSKTKVCIICPEHR